MDLIRYLNDSQFTSFVAVSITSGLTFRYAPEREGEWLV
jgi:hypothetical protein